MTELDPNQEADRWEAEYNSACDELRDEMLGADGATCVLIVERWEKRYWKHPQIGHFIVNRARDLQMALRKDPKSGGDIIIQGDNNTVQQGANVSQQGNNNVAGDSTPFSSANDESRASNWKAYSNVAAGAVAGLLAGWWLLPESWSLGPTRNVVTATLVVASLVMGALSWFQFNRQVWEKVAYISLGTILILRSAIPTITGFFQGKGEATAQEVSGEAVGHLSISDVPLLVVFQVGAAVILLGFAFFTKPGETPT